MSQENRVYSSPAPHHYAFFHEIKYTHAVLATLAWMIFFPLGVFVLRMLGGRPYAVRTHMLVQILAFSCYAVAFGMGIWMAQITRQMNKYHCVIGLVIFALAFLSAVGGYIHHKMYTGYRNSNLNRIKPIAPVHVWLGRALITLGMINGGLGLLMADDASRVAHGAYGLSSKGQKIAYGVVAGGIWGALVMVVVQVERTKRAAKRAVVENELRVGK